MAIATAGEWRAKGAVAAAVELTLPSGVTIRARRPNPLEFARWEKLPLMLVTAAEKGAGSMAAAEIVETARFLRELLVFCCVEPRVALGSEAGEGEILAGEICEADWTYITQWGMRMKEVAEVRPFRGKRAVSGGGGDGENIFVQTVAVDGDRGPGAGAGDRPGGGGGGMEGGEGGGERRI
jgi:hypothetical protein